jgi:integrase/recombinase XerD
MHHLEIEDSENPILFVRYANPSYRYKERKIPITAEWIEAYQEYLIQYDIKDHVFPWSQRRLEYLLEDMGKESGLEKHLSFDMCRWTCGLTDYQAGIEHNKIRQKMGVSKIQWREIGMKLARLSNGEEPAKLE